MDDRRPRVKVKIENETAQLNMTGTEKEWELKGIVRWKRVNRQQERKGKNADSVYTTDTQPA
jgi:hypothetical protein